MASVPPTGPEPPEQPKGPGQPDWGEMKSKIAAARGTDRMILIAGAVFFVASFLPWYGFGFGGVGANISGWNSGGLAVVSILLALAATAFALVRVLGMNLSLGTVNDGLVYLALGGGAFVFVLVRLLTARSLTQYGLYIAIAAGAALALGGLRKYKAPQS